MTFGIRLAALAIAVASNGAVLAAMHIAMSEHAEKETRALQQTPRIVITVPRDMLERDIAARKSCPAS